MCVVVDAVTPGNAPFKLGVSRQGHSALFESGESPLPYNVHPQR